MASAPGGPGMAAAAAEVKVYYGKPMQLDVSRVLACLYEKDVNFKSIDMFQGKPMPDLIKLQASTRAQVIGFEDGPIFLHDSRAICRYVAEKYADRGNKYLLGRDLLDRASIEQWLKSEEQSFDPPSRELIFYIAFGPHTDNSAPNRDLITQSLQKLANVLDIYEQRLSRSRYLAGDEFTLADLNHLPNSYYLATTGYRDYLFDKRTNVERWWEDISDRPSWTKVAELMTEDARVQQVKKEPSIEVKKDVASTEKTEKVFLVPPPPTSSFSLVSPSIESPKTQSDTPQHVVPTTREKVVRTSEQAQEKSTPSPPPTAETTVSSQTTARTEITNNTTTEQAQAPDKSKLPPPKTDESKAKSLAISQPIAERRPSKEPASSETQSSTQTSNNSKRTTAALRNGKTTTEAIQNSSSIQTKEPAVSNGELSRYDTSTSEMSKESSLSTKKARSQDVQKAEKSVAQSETTDQTPSISETTGTRTQPGVANTTESTQSPNSSNFEAKTDPSIDSDSKSDSRLQS